MQWLRHEVLVLRAPASAAMQELTPNNGYEAVGVADHHGEELWTRVMFSLDVGMHTSGWFKNPDYDRCMHLSLSFWEPGARKPAPYDDKLAELWVADVFRDDVNLIWTESAFSDVGKQVGVKHYRVFCDEHWVPLLPRKEVYTREFTEAGFKSWSEQHPEREGHGDSVMGHGEGQV